MAVAAYAAVVSLIHVLDDIQHPGRPRLRLDRDRIETLRKKVSFLQDFLELHSQIKSNVIEYLAMQICDVAVEAENVIDTHVVDQRRAIYSFERGRALSLFCEDIDRVIRKIGSIEKELIMFNKEQLPGVSVPAVLAAPPSISSGQNTMVGFDEHLVRIMDLLTNTGYKSDLQILPIVGMGGIGKTTLARNVFDHPCIEYHFHVRLWITISQEYSNDQILCSLLQELGILVGQKNNKSGEDLAELGEKLYKGLSGRTYLVVMDDLWSANAWQDLMLFFPNNGNGSQIMVTTRLSNVAISLGCRSPYLMDFLDEDQSWNLLCEKAFGQTSCPSELEEVGKDIAKSCKGLPLAIVVIGGLLSTSNMTREYWEFVAENVNSFANSENDEHCLKILSLSYNHLPIHLKPCFLYMRVFREDDEIPVFELMLLWVAQGFLKPIKDKTLEEVARKYLKDLVDRNLILIPKRMHRGKTKTCRIHDLLRDLCHREFQKEHFLRVPKMQKTCVAKWKGSCFLCDNYGQPCTITSLSRVIAASQATSAVNRSVCQICTSMYPQLDAVRLVRVTNGYFFSEEMLHPTKLRYLVFRANTSFNFVYSSMPLLWNLQTLIIQKTAHASIFLPDEIWEMPQLRHLITDEAMLPDPVVTQTNRPDSTVILENLQTLSKIMNFKCSEEVVVRVPNLRKLKIWYDHREWASLHNLAHLHKLESLDLEGTRYCYILKAVVFPHSLKRLTLSECKISREEMTVIGSLPNLEVLQLLYNIDLGSEWNPVEGEFLKLKLLSIMGSNLKCWGAEKVHFPNLESLILQDMYNLKEIPAGIGEIETLQLIDLCDCSKSIVNSAKQIQEEQESLGIEGLQLHVRETSMQSFPLYGFSWSESK